MKAQIVLTPSESKRLIAKAVSQMENVKKALKKGRIVICRGSTNAYIAEEITGRRIDKGGYALGYIRSTGLIVSIKASKESYL